ncbi:hypothetical protein HPB50_009195 [Hyalomma asiaticum]|uniref:Uncharacterized protein n=1 Tax=Hyalomma asiaticum TaxID=266040 RepID=A0ACB7SFA3_HYAAI|nr:hypothetical protein HPB50_009195 [Hyalomma asiaticum]
MAQSAVSTTVHEVSEAIISVAARKQLVHFSLMPAAKQRAKVAFSRRGCIPGVLACVDGTLVATEKPQGLSLGDTESYMTRKGYALNVMVVCDAELRILVIDPRFPGSCHDSWVWRRNPLREQLASQHQPGEYVLGYPRLDSGRLRKYGSFVQEIPLIGKATAQRMWLSTPLSSCRVYISLPG